MNDSDRIDVLKSLRLARKLIDKRGYQPEWGKGGGSPLNISNALTLACGKYETYVLARQCFSKNWGGPETGLLHWETYKRHTKDAALQLFDTVIDLVEQRRISPPGIIGSQEQGGTGYLNKVL